MRNTITASVLGIALTLTGTVSRADIAITFGNSPTTFNSALDATRGWEFSTSEAISVSALGIWDMGSDGLADSHQVGLWDTSGNLLASVSFAAGNSGTLMGPDGFRFLDLASPVNLAVGSYLIGAAYAPDDDDQIAYLAGPMSATGISYVGPKLSADGTGFAPPTDDSAASGGAFGPNFLFTEASAVPEPSTFTMAGAITLLGIGYGLLKRHRATR
jgi:hypothetical protein